MKLYKDMGTEVTGNYPSLAHPSHFFFLFLIRMTLYVGKDEAGFYVSKALVHTGVALVVRNDL